MIEPYSDANQPDGWQALPQLMMHVIYDGLYAGGVVVATIEAFYDDGPYYAVALVPGDDRWSRSGAMDNLPAARRWAEITAGVRPELP